MDSEMKPKIAPPLPTSTRRSRSSSSSRSNSSSKAPTLTGNKENDDKKRCCEGGDVVSLCSSSRVGVSLCSSSRVGVSLSTHATPPGPPPLSDARKPLKDLLTTSNPRQDWNRDGLKGRGRGAGRGRGRGAGRGTSSLSEQQQQQQHLHLHLHLRKCSSTPTPTTNLNHTPSNTATATATPNEHHKSSSSSRMFKFNMSGELQGSNYYSRNSSECGLNDKGFTLDNSHSTMSRSGKLPSQSGMKKNSGFDTGNLRKNFSGRFGSGKPVADRKRHDAKKEEDDSFQGRSEEIRVNLTTVRSPKATSAAAALQRVEATPLQKVYFSNLYSSPGHRLLEKRYDHTTPAPRFRGRYEDSIPTHVFLGREDAVFLSPTIGRGGDFTPAPTTNGNRGDFTPARHSMHTTPEQRTQVTPPVQPSISPEIHFQILDELKDGHRCFGAGHVMAPVLGKVRDRRKCRPMGILTAGEATPIPLDENRSFPSVPVPVVASVKWMSPRDAKTLTNLPVTPATPSSGFTQGSLSISSNNPTSQAIPPSGFTQGTPSSGFNSKNPSPQATSLSAIVDSSFSSGFSSSPTPQAGPLYGFAQATPWSGFCSKLSSHQSTTSGFTPETENLSTIIPTRFAQEVPYIQGMSSSGLTTGPGNLEGTPSLGISSKFQNLIATPSSTSSKQQNHLSTTTSGLNLEILNGQGISTPDYNQEMSNLHATSSLGFCPQVLSWYESNLDISPQCRFHPYNSSQCGESHGVTRSVSSQFGFNPDAFPRDIDSHRACLSLENLVISSQCTGYSEVVRSSKLQASSMDKDNLRLEMQMPMPSSKDFNQVRISWREGLISRIFKLSELDCCDLTLKGDEKRKEVEIVSISRENHLLSPEDDMKLEYSCSFSNDLQPDAPFGSFEYLSVANAEKSDPFLLLASSLPQENALSESLVRSFISPASQGVEAESIYPENVTRSGDVDWTFCYKNQLFEEATRVRV